MTEPAQHSLKPWEWRYDPEHDAGPSLFAGDVLVLQTSDFPFNDGLGVGNAHVVRAAPDLLDALQAFLEPNGLGHVVDCGEPMEDLEGFVLCDCGFQRRIDAAQAAVAKATGDVRWILAEQRLSKEGD